ncbi:MAG TPA: flagellar FlbD family protein [Spirochaetota bacterium]|nr:flagellar FlbD family protein [Spirochaetota bacterium]HOM37990.1 flagellar FlbD family protein [Spirochaetota bacterium]HPQ48794.1 flagellar FlbD family protein [Spirochaetota bacterium]
MIEATKLNGKTIYINPHLIESIEEEADTRINFITGKMIIVKENTQELIDRIIKYRRKLGINSQED